MDSKSKNRLLTAVIIILGAAIALLLFLIIRRGAEPLKNAKEPYPRPLASNGVIFESEEAEIKKVEEVKEKRVTLMAGGRIDARTGVNVRSAPGTSSEVLFSASPGQYVQILEAPSDGWAHIMYGSREGYMSMDFIVTGLITTDGTGKTGFEEMEYKEAAAKAAAVSSNGL